MLNRDSILNHSATAKTITVPLPEFGEDQSVLVKMLTTAEFFALLDLEKKHKDQQFALWWIACVVDEAGERLFAESDIAALSRLPIAAVKRVVDAAQRLNIPKDPKGN